MTEVVIAKNIDIISQNLVGEIKLPPKDFCKYASIFSVSTVQ